MDGILIPILSSIAGIVGVILTILKNHVSKKQIEELEAKIRIQTEKGENFVSLDQALDQIKILANEGKKISLEKSVDGEIKIRIVAKGEEADDRK